MKKLTTAAFILANIALTAPASAEVRWPGASSIDWPFGEHRLCLGYSGVREFKKPLGEFARARLADVGQDETAQFVSANWSDAILNEQLLHAYEVTLEQCKKRASAQAYSTECPLGSLPTEDAVKIVGGDKDSFWEQPSTHLNPLKMDQKARLEALKPLIKEACGP